MYIAFALQTEPELQFVQLSFCVTETECKTAVEQMCKQFADDIPVELDWVGFPDEPMPSPEQISDPNFILAIHAKIIEAFSGEPDEDEPIESESELNVELESVYPHPDATSRLRVLELGELQRLENAGLITQAESKQRCKAVFDSIVKRNEKDSSETGF